MLFLQANQEKLLALKRKLQVNVKAKKKKTKPKSLEEKRKMASENQKNRRAKIYAGPHLYSKFLERQKKKTMRVGRKGD